MNDFKRFWKNVCKTESCWVWTGATTHNGCGWEHTSNYHWKDMEPCLMGWVYLPSCPSCRSSLERVGDYSRHNICLNGKQCVTSKKTRIGRKSSRPASGMVCCMMRQSGTTSEHSTGDHGVEEWISSLPDGLVSRGGVEQVISRAPTMNAICGRKPFASFEKSGPGSSCWRTSQKSLYTDTQIQFSGTWPRAGMVCRVTAYQLPPLVPFIREIDFGLWPTPCARDYKGTSSQGRRRNDPSPDTLPDAIAQILGIPLDQSGVVDPTFTEKLMLLPTMWSDLSPLGLPRFRLWLRSHGGS